MKKVFALLLSALMVACCLTGCSKPEEPKGPVAIKIGGSGPLTGPAAEYGLAVRNAAELAVAEINAKGGLQFELKFEDDTHDPEVAVNAYGILKDWGVQVSLLCVTSKPCYAVADYYNEDGIFCITPSGSSDGIIVDRENVFQMCFTDSNQGLASADYFAMHFADKKIGVIYQNDIDYSKGVYESFAAQAAKNNLNIVATTSFISGDVDFSTQVKACKDAGADLVFLPIYYDEAAVILRQASDADYAPVFFGVDGLDGILGVKNFDTSLAEGVYLLTPFAADATDPKTQAFVSAFNAKYTGLNQFGADAYDAVYAIYEACVKGGVTADMTAKQISEILKAQFTSMQFEGITGAGAAITWSAGGAVSKAPMAVVIKDGVYVSAE